MVECHEDEYDALARQLHESIAEGQSVVLTAKALRILAASPSSDPDPGSEMYKRGWAAGALANAAVVHVGDPDDRARSYNDGFDEALRQYGVDRVEVCSCGGRRWVEDENWLPEDYRRNDPRTEADGLIPCGFCNEAGWDVPQWAPDPTPRPSGRVKATELLDADTRRTRCSKSPTGRHDYYVLRPTIDPADVCRWCGRILDLAASPSSDTRPGLVALTAMTAARDAAVVEADNLREENGYLEERLRQCEEAPYA